MTRAHVAPGARTRSAAAACTETAGEIDMVLSSYRQVSPRSTADAGGLEVFGLDPALLPQALAIRDWLLTEAAQLADSGQILPGLAERLTAVGVPIDRMTTAIDVLHSEYAGMLLPAGSVSDAAGVGWPAARLPISQSKFGPGRSAR